MAARSATLVQCTRKYRSQTSAIGAQQSDREGPKLCTWQLIPPPARRGGRRSRGAALRSAPASPRRGSTGASPPPVVSPARRPLRPLIPPFIIPTTFCNAARSRPNPLRRPAFSGGGRVPAVFANARPRISLAPPWFFRAADKTVNAHNRQNSTTFASQQMRAARISRPPTRTREPRRNTDLLESVASLQGIDSDT